LIEDLENQGMKAIQSTLSSAFGITNNWKNAPKLITTVIERESNGIAFAQVDENKKTKHPLATIPCFKCQEKGHYLLSVPKEQSDTQMLLDVKKLKTAWMKMNLHSSLWQYSVNNQT
jgi:hypothetical protein